MCQARKNCTYCGGTGWINFDTHQFENREGYMPHENVRHHKYLIGELEQKAGTCICTIIDTKLVDIKQ